MPSFPPNTLPQVTMPPAPPSTASPEQPVDDAIARSKRVLALIDAYIDKPTSDARCAIRTQLMHEFEQSDRATRAAEKAQAEALSSLRDQAALHRLALVPLRLTQPMRDVLHEEDWDWGDLLAAAESVDEESYRLAAMNATGLPEQAIDDFIDSYVLEADGGAISPTEHERTLLKDAMMGLVADPAFAAALSEQLPAAPKPAFAVFSDHDIIAIRQRARAADPAQRWGDTLAFGRALIEATFGGHAQHLLAIAARLQRGAPGTEVWRVAKPNGAYCMERSRDDTFYPQRECDEWIAAHADYAAAGGYTTQKAHVYSQKEALMRTVASELLRLAGAPDELVDCDDEAASSAPAADRPTHR